MKNDFRLHNKGLGRVMSHERVDYLKVLVALLAELEKCMYNES